MIHNNLISAGTIIAKAIADFDIKESDIKISDWKEWCMEGLLKIGAVNQFEHKVVILPIVGGQVKLPCDLYKLDQVAYSFGGNGGWLAMRKTSASFGVLPVKGTCPPNMYAQDSSLIPLIKILYNIYDDAEALAKLNSDDGLRQTLSMLLNQYTVNSVNGFNIYEDLMKDLQYATKPGYIMTSIMTGYVKISYYAIYTDEEGMPLIPDMESYKEALLWYLGVKHFYPKKLKGLISTQDYYDIRNSYNFYRKQAYAEAMVPTVDDMTSIKNTQLTLYPQVNEEDTFFNHTGAKQIIYNWNN